jgi:hypothetical protein
MRGQRTARTSKGRSQPALVRGGRHQHPSMEFTRIGKGILSRYLFTLGLTPPLGMPQWHQAPPQREGGREKKNLGTEVRASPRQLAAATPANTPACTMETLLIIHAGHRSKHNGSGYRGRSLTQTVGHGSARRHSSLHNGGLIHAGHRSNDVSGYRSQSLTQTVGHGNARRHSSLHSGSNITQAVRAK